MLVDIISCFYAIFADFWEVFHQLSKSDPKWPVEIQLAGFIAHLISQLLNLMSYLPHLILDLFRKVAALKLKWYPPKRRRKSIRKTIQEAEEHYG